MKLREIMFFYVYVLQSMKNDTIYIGFTTDLKKRLQEHNLGLTSSTKRFLPWELIYYEACRNKQDAIRREKYLKTNQGGRLLKRRLKEYFFQSNKREVLLPGATI
ncbi:MAG: GIY-YIG nuclease superfamily protein [Candidatus Gottesmanbacteria bacterium GW2011_GWA1_43_11]|uniref:GIY-YIG nuclease superfamily protein n=1 Tax=Candidatus Gottesmanbacteria bacterium GW2011_GWA1_43_11 TaxID=1618436 RepID=A0A0G1CFQ5_9BACT|nr:MAG: GIY-YIG nuclease superfamily protein [Candidatus Gottesmanbacteria bacterium GW2011_GWA1_43_11]